MCVPLTCLEMRSTDDDDWVSATREALELGQVQVRTSSTFQEHGHKFLHHRPVEVVEQITTADEQINALEDNLKKLAETWETCFTDEAWTPYLHVVVCHTLPLMKHHLRLGHFSQQVVENFHKLVRWLCARTNREGGNAEDVQESSMNIMQLFWGQKMLEMEAREGNYNQDMINALKQCGSQPPVCNCSMEGRACGWVSRKRGRED